MGELTISTRCPECNGGFGFVSGPNDTEPETPPPDAIANCFQCGHLWVWDVETGWVAPTPAQRAAMLDDQEVVDLVTFGREIAEARERDRDAIRRVATEAMLEVAKSTYSVDEAAAALAEVLQQLGFHTHPQQED